VPGATRGLCLTTKETVARETLACAATSLKVAWRRASTSIIAVRILLVATVFPSAP